MDKKRLIVGDVVRDIRAGLPDVNYFCASTTIIFVHG
jgi:hypothetical protein